MHLLDRLARHRPPGRAPRGAALRDLLARLGDPQHGLRAVHIVGSKGKGSTALYLEGLLQDAGARTGVFTSPHLVRWTERFRVAGREIDEAELAQLLDRVAVARDRLSAALRDELSFFDAATAAAFLLFRQADVEWAVLEAGLGGVRDATSVCEPVVTCLTSVEREHTAVLGNSLQAIAREKAGVARPGVPMVLGALPRAARPVALRCCLEAGAPVLRCGHAFHYRSRVDEHGVALRFRGFGLDFRSSLPVAGRHLVRCAALATACVASLPGVELESRRVAGALRRVTLPGRAEVLCRHPLVLVDGAHTAASAAALGETLARLDATAVHLVLSMGRDKPVPAFLRPLRARLRRVTVTCAEPARSLPARELAGQVAGACPDLVVRHASSVARAVDEALQRLAGGEALCIAGSVYLAGTAREYLRGRYAA